MMIALSVNSVYTTGQVVCTLPEGEWVHGVTSLAGKIYLLRERDCDQVEVYDVETYSLQRRLHVKNYGRLNDLTSCEHHRYIYFADDHNTSILKLDVERVSLTRWDVHDTPCGLSVNAAHNLLVTCPLARKIKEFDSGGKLLHELALPDGVIHPWHTIQTPAATKFIVCYGGSDDAIRGVCVISTDDFRVVDSHGGQAGSGNGQYKVPRHLAVDDNGFVFAVDLFNRRVTLLSPTLEYFRQIVSLDQLKGWPDKLHLDAQRRLLYVADNESRTMSSSGRVAVFRV